jgi:hypothetical protein
MSGLRKLQEFGAGLTEDQEVLQFFRSYPRSHWVQ